MQLWTSGREKMPIKKDNLLLTLFILAALTLAGCGAQAEETLTPAPPEPADILVTNCGDLPHLQCKYDGLHTYAYTLTEFADEPVCGEPDQEGTVTVLRDFSDDQFTVEFGGGETTHEQTGENTYVYLTEQDGQQWTYITTLTEEALLLEATVSQPDGYSGFCWMQTFTRIDP